MRVNATLRDCEASALAEFAVALPLLVVLVYGIFDFGGAFTLKEKLSNAAREGARLASSEPTNDLDSSTPATITNVRALVDAYLVAASINDCGLNTTAVAANLSTLTWTYTTSGGGCPAPLVLTINRSVPLPPGNAGTVTTICTNVSLTYAYQWHFNSVIQLVAPGANYLPYTLMTVDATAPNTD